MRQTVFEVISADEVYCRISRHTEVYIRDMMEICLFVVPGGTTDYYQGLRVNKNSSSDTFIHLNTLDVKQLCVKWWYMVGVPSAQVPLLYPM